MRTFSVRAYGVLRRGDEVLLTRSRFGERTFINFPGGGVDIGEGPGEGLLREYREETGLEVRATRLLHASEKAHLSTQAPIQIVSLYWLVERVSGDLRLTGNGDDVLELFWRPASALPLSEMFPADLEFCERLPGLLAP